MPAKTCQTVENPKKSECWTDIPVLNRRTWCRDRFCRRDDSSDFATAVFPRRRILLLVRLLSVWFWLLFCHLYISTLLRFIGLYVSPRWWFFKVFIYDWQYAIASVFYHVFLQTSWQTATKKPPLWFPNLFFNSHNMCVCISGQCWRLAD